MEVECVNENGEHKMILSNEFNAKAIKENIPKNSFKMM